MQTNIGPVNRIARLIAGIIILAASFAYLDKQSILFFVGFVIGILLLLEAAFAHCIMHYIRGTKDMR